MDAYQGLHLSKREGITNVYMKRPQANAHLVYVWLASISVCILHKCIYYVHIYKTVVQKVSLIKPEQYVIYLTSIV